MKRLKRRPFTLLEVLISLSLTTIILGVLLSAYFQAESLTIQSKRRQTELEPKRALASRLEEIFQNLNTKQLFFLSESNPALVFSYDNGPNLDLPFSGDVISRLFLDNAGGLILITWPERSSWPEGALPRFRREVLLQNIESVEFKFFALPNETQMARWVDQWPKELNDLPGMIRLTIKPDQGNPESFLFFVPQKIGEVKK